MDYEKAKAENTRKLKEVEEDIESSIAEIEALKEQYKRQMRVYKAEKGKEFRKRRTRLLVQIGGEWMKYGKDKIEPDSDFDKILENQFERMNRIYKSVLTCEVCNAGLLLRDNDHFTCENCGATFQEPRPIRIAICRKCGGQMKKAESKKTAGKYFWYCEKNCGAKSVWDKDGFPNFGED